jgi:DNA-directed RNA polymerase subunit RPC12/RpoP
MPDILPQPRWQMLKLMCIDCGYRFRKRVDHFSQRHLWKQRSEAIAAIRCPRCSSRFIDSDPDSNHP